jgi:L-lactate permease
MMAPPECTVGLRLYNDAACNVLLPLLSLLQIAATTIGAPVTSMLAVQVAGATIGNMICINNILVRRQQPSYSY